LNCDPQLCPLAVTTHLPAAAFDDYLNAADPALWCKSGPWANGDPAFDVSWDNTANHIDFPAASGLMTMTLTDFGTDANHPCSSGNCFGRSFASGEYRTNCFYGYGTYEAKFKTASPRGDGLVTSFFVYTGTPDGTIFDGGQDWHDEIDIEIFGRAPDPNKQQEAQCSPTDTLMQTNYFVKGIGGHEHITCLPFDASAGLHTYRFVWSQNKIEFYYDPPAVNPVAAWTENRVPPDAPWPAQPGRIIMNTWAGNSTDPPTVNWLGTFSYQGVPRQAQYDEMHYY
jgi:beta-glucanase (GH16 family)